MSEQDVDKLTGALWREIQALKRDIAALSAWISSFRDAAKALDSQLHPVLHPNRLTINAAPVCVKVAAIDKLAEYPIDQLAVNIAGYMTSAIYFTPRKNCWRRCNSRRGARLEPQNGFTLPAPR